ncbi:GlsB/YeaQ/YmgE family stress response membrane protein [uncultured Roseobacter sp.]|uniref:GlsB/YeaQ/YmgE family stress response membrane protein n=1 Tax=uncultured Roseobacter sp. TaxID=114847 RepID=UPI002614622C|nr:GlsB/YeaQ/YmgE family stress response membrane protein [uncultured Roseobacter sp.]
MTGIGWIGSLIIGAFAGWIAEKIMKSDQSLIMNIVLGIVGALVLNALLFAVLGTTLGGWIGQLIVAAAGACLLIYVVRLLRGRT